MVIAFVYCSLLCCDSQSINSLLRSINISCFCFFSWAQKEINVPLTTARVSHVMAESTYPVWFSFRNVFNSFVILSWGHLYLTSIMFSHGGPQYLQQRKEVVREVNSSNSQLLSMKVPFQHTHKKKNLFLREKSKKSILPGVFCLLNIF